MFTLRNACISDLMQIMHVEQEAFIPSIRESYSTFEKRINLFPQGFIVFISKTKKIAGYLCTEIWDGIPDNNSFFSMDHDISKIHNPAGKTLYISSFALLKEFCAKGFGKKLFLQTLEYFCKELSPHSICLLVNEIWHNALHIYQSCGFTKTGIVPDIFPSENLKDKNTGIVMIKHIIY